MASSFFDKPVDPHTVLVGEVGLTGEVRAVGRMDIRIKESSKLGFRRCVLPQGNIGRLSAFEDMKLIGVRSLQEVLPVLFGQVFGC